MSSELEIPNNSYHNSNSSCILSYSQISYTSSILVDVRVSYLISYWPGKHRSRHKFCICKSRHKFCIHGTLIAENTRVCHIQLSPRWPSWILMFESIKALWECHIWTPWLWKLRSKHQFCINRTIIGEVTKVCYI